MRWNGEPGVSGLAVGVTLNGWLSDQCASEHFTVRVRIL